MYTWRGGEKKPPIFIPINAILSPEMYLGKKKKRPTPALLRLCFLSLRDHLYYSTQSQAVVIRTAGGWARHGKLRRF